MSSVRPFRCAPFSLASRVGAGLCLGAALATPAAAQGRGHATPRSAPIHNVRPQTSRVPQHITEPRPVQPRPVQPRTIPAQQVPLTQTQPSGNPQHPSESYQTQPYQAQPSPNQLYGNQQRQGQVSPSQPAQPPPARQGVANSPLVSPGHPAQSQQHLPGWMDAHRNLSPAQQHSALEAEPGFRDLKPEEQQRLHNQLTRLNGMSPQQQRMVIQRNEAMERLSVPQRQQVRAAAYQLANLPPSRVPVVARTFRMLRDMPEAQRQAYLNSPQYHSQFNDQERAVLGNLVNVAPLLPPAAAPSGQPR